MPAVGKDPPQRLEPAIEEVSFFGEGARGGAGGEQGGEGDPHAPES
jgi:hypothetical protein